jgi:protein SCO1/2
MARFRLLKKILILVFILFIPGFFYYLMTSRGQNRYHALRIFGPKIPVKKYDSAKGKFVTDTIFHQVGDFKLTDQDGKEVSFKTYNDKVLVVGFFYTHCATLCNTINGYIDSLDRNYAQGKMVQFASITVDPKRDSVGALKKYAAQFADRNAKWKFLTGDTATIYNLARKGFLVNAVDQGNGNFIYSDQLILLDSHRRIRGYYTGASLTDVTRLNDEIKVLVKQELLERDTPMY